MNQVLWLGSLGALNSLEVLGLGILRRHEGQRRLGSGTSDLLQPALGSGKPSYEKVWAIAGNLINEWT